MLTALSFPDADLWPGAPLGLGLLYLALRRDSARWNALLGLLWGLTVYLPLLWWAYTSVGVVPWVALSTAVAGFQAATSALWTWWRRWETRPGSGGGHRALRRWLDPVAFATLWVAAEQARSVWPFGGFPWGRLAFSQVGSPLLPLAWLGGAPLVSGVVVLVGALAAEAGLALRRDARRAAAVGAAAAALLVVAGLAVPLDTAAERGTLRVGVVQGNVPGQGLEAFGRQWQVLDNHVAGTRALLDRVAPGDLDLVLWPENGTDVDPQADATAAGLIDGAARAVDAPMLVGTVQYPATGGRYNTAVVWQPGVGVVDQYSKQRPAPFGEYVPLRSLVRHFSSAVDLVSQDMIAGTKPGIVHVAVPRLGRDVGIGVVICFEVAYDDLVDSAVTHGGEVLVVQTNNASFGWTAESTQQLAMTQLRAVEHGRTAVQVSTVGVSAVVEPDGTVVDRTRLFTAAQIVATLPLRTSTTPATWLGPWPGRAAAFATLAAIVGCAASAVRRRTSSLRSARSATSTTGMSTTSTPEPSTTQTDTTDGA